MNNRTISEERVERVAAILGPHLRQSFSINPDCEDQARAHDHAREVARAALEAVGSDVERMRSTLAYVEHRLALKRITEHYPPDTIAGRLAADVLAKYPNKFENADRENDSEPFEVEAIKGLRRA